MKRYIKGLLRKFVNNAPLKLIDNTKSVLSRIIGEEELERILIIRFSKWIMEDFETKINKIKAKGKCMEVTELVWPGTYFNIAVLDNVMALIIYSLYKECIPVFKFNDNINDKFQWEWYFVQPSEVMGINNIEDFEKISCNVKLSPFRPAWEAFHIESEEFKIWQFFYQKFAILNQKTGNYVKSQMESVGDVSQMCGVLARGTDYVALKPLGHPKQPDIKDIISKVKEASESIDFCNIFVATEDKRLYDKITNAFEQGMVVCNERMYYDEAYLGTKGITLIGQINFDRENDNFLKGIEYLTTLMILSSCKAIIAGNCGGTQFAVLYSNSYKYRYIFNEGFYE